MQQEEVAPRRRAPKEDQDDHAAFDLPLARDVEHCWRRLVWRALLALSAARLQVVLCEVVEIEPAYSFYHEAPRAKGDRRPARHGLAGGYLHAPPSEASLGGTLKPFMGSYEHIWGHCKVFQK